MARKNSWRPFLGNKTKNVTHVVMIRLVCILKLHTNDFGLEKLSISSTRNTCQNCEHFDPVSYCSTAVEKYEKNHIWWKETWILISKRFFFGPNDLRNYAWNNNNTLTQQRKMPNCGIKQLYPLDTLWSDQFWHQKVANKNECISMIDHSAAKCAAQR